MLNQLNQDREMAMDYNKEPLHTGSLMEIIGCDVNSKTYKDMLRIDYSYDNSVISSGGNAYTAPASSTQINIQDQRTIHFLDKYCVGGTIEVVNGVIPNILNLFSGRQIVIGKKILSTGDNHYFSQMMFSTKSQKQIQKYQRGLKYNISNFVGTQTPGDIMTNYAADLVNWNYYQQEWNGSDPVVQNPADGAALTQAQQAVAFQTYHVYRFNFEVPLSLIFPEISQFEDGVYLDDGNTVTANITFNPANLFIINTQATAPSYKVWNLHLVRCQMPNLLDEQISRIKSSHILYRGIRGYVASLNQLHQSNQIIAAIPQNAVLKGFIYGAFYAENRTVNNNAVAAIFANTENVVSGATLSQLAIPLQFAPVIPYRQLILNVGALTRVYNAYQVQNLHQQQNVQDYDNPYIQELQKQLMSIGVLDNQRCQDDLFGAQVAPAQVSLTFEVQTGGKSVLGQYGLWQDAVAANTNTASLNNYSLRCYAILQEDFAYSNGQWRI